MIWAIREVSSRVPDKFGMKPFCISCSVKLLGHRKTKIMFPGGDVNMLGGTNSSVSGQKFAGSIVSPIL